MKLLTVMLLGLFSLIFSAPQAEAIAVRQSWLCLEALSLGRSNGWTAISDVAQHPDASSFAGNARLSFPNHKKGSVFLEDGRLRAIATIPRLANELSEENYEAHFTLVDEKYEPISRGKFPLRAFESISKFLALPVPSFGTPVLLAFTNERILEITVESETLIVQQLRLSFDSPAASLIYEGDAHSAAFMIEDLSDAQNPTQKLAVTGYQDRMLVFDFDPKRPYLARLRLFNSSPAALSASE